MKNLNVLAFVCASLAVGCSSVVVFETDDSSNGSAGAAGAPSTGGNGQSYCLDGSTPSEKISIELDPATPSARIVVASENYWTVFAQYVVENLTDEDLDIVSARVEQIDPNGDAADFSEIGIAMDGALKISGETYDENESFVLDQVWPQGFILSAHTSKTIQVWGKIPYVLSSSAANGEWHGVPRSGHTPALRLQEVRLADDPTCSVAGEGNPPSMVIRKSKPTFVQHPLPSNVLANTDLDLIKFQISADAAGPIAVKSFYFTCTNIPSAKKLSNFRLRRGSVDIPLSDYDIAGGIGYAGGGLVPLCHRIFVFKNEEIITGSGNLYTLHAQMSGAVQGDSFTWATASATFYQGQEPYIPTGSLANFLDAGPHGNVQIVDANNAGSNVIPGLPWSDLSEDPHDPSFDGSADWTSDSLVEGWGEMEQALSL